MMMKAEMYKIGSIGDGFLAIMARPSLEQGDAASMVNIARLGINLVVSLLEPLEARTLELDGEREYVKAEGMGFLSFPIPDMGLPASVEDFARTSKLLFEQTYAGNNTLVHCHAGIGRSGLLAAGILLFCQMNPEQAFAHVSKMRGIRVPETPEQTDWLVSNYEAIRSVSGSDQ
jgi:protein-tyrosine phosphatase